MIFVAVWCTHLGQLDLPIIANEPLFRRASVGHRKIDSPSWAARGRDVRECRHPYRRIKTVTSTPVSPSARPHPSRARAAGVRSPGGHRSILSGHREAGGGEIRRHAAKGTPREDERQGKVGGRETEEPEQLLLKLMARLYTQRPVAAPHGHTEHATWCFRDTPASEVQFSVVLRNPECKTRIIPVGWGE